MKIARVSVRRLTGALEWHEEFWEDRYLRPVDVYSEFRESNHNLKAGYVSQAAGASGNMVPVEGCFVEIETEDGLVGVAGPTGVSVGLIIAHQLKPLLLGRDPLASEFLWDLMHRALVHGRHGEPMMAISLVDCALWDLKGKWLNQPVYRVLGGPTRPSLPVYASMLGFNARDMDKVARRAREHAEKGFVAQKWFFRYGPASGTEGLRKNIELVETLRATLGPDYRLMFDCWQGMDIDYSVRLARAIEHLHPTWLEESLMPDRPDGLARIAAKTSVPLSGGEHNYTRWGYKDLLELNALSVIQPDAFWCGGFSELLKISAYGTVHDVKVIPHGASTHVTAHYSVLQSPYSTPMQEYLVKWNELAQFFFAKRCSPERGEIAPLDLPGFGIVLDPAKIKTETDLTVS